MSDLPSGFRQPLTERAVYFLGYRAVGPILRKIHSKPVPRIGGVVILLSATVLIVGVLFLDNSIREAFRGVQTQVVTLPASGTFIFLAGLVDDLHRIKARHTLFAQVASAVAIYSMVF